MRALVGVDIALWDLKGKWYLVCDLSSQAKFILMISTKYSQEAWYSHLPAAEGEAEE